MSLTLCQTLVLSLCIPQVFQVMPFSGSDSYSHDCFHKRVWIIRRLTNLTCQWHRQWDGQFPVWCMVEPGFKLIPTGSEPWTLTSSAVVTEHMFLWASHTKPSMQRGKYRQLYVSFCETTCITVLEIEAHLHSFPKNPHTLKWLFHLHKTYWLER